MITSKVNINVFEIWSVGPFGSGLLHLNFFEKNLILAFEANCAAFPWLHFFRIFAHCPNQKQWIMHTYYIHRMLLPTSTYNWTKTTQKFASFLCGRLLLSQSSLKILDNFWTKLKLAVIICSLHVKFNSADDCCRIWLS